MRFIPNTLSLSRAVLAPLIALSAVYDKWELAFMLLIMGLATDWFDGLLAVKLDAKSDLGAKVLEPYCDFVLTVGAVGGLVLTEHVSWGLVITLLVFSVVAYIISISLGSNRLISFCRGVLPFGYLVVILATTVIYAVKAFGSYAAWLLPPALAIGVIAIRIKKDRLRSWIQEFRGG